jgi:outer membrane protein OmpA-like peptidoglycan-associated protein
MKYLILTAHILLASSICGAQIKAPRRLLERKANEAIEKKIDKALEKPEQKQEKLPAENTSDKKNGMPSSKADKPAADSLAGLKAYSKFDFTPGEKIVFYDDFVAEQIGDFPSSWNTNGSGEVVTNNMYSGKWLKFATRSALWTDQLLKLSENYTVEFDIVPIKGDNDRMQGYDFRMIESINPNSYDHGSVPGKAGFLFSCEYSGRTSYRAYSNEGEGSDMSGYKDGERFYQKENHKYHIAIWVQKTRLRLYQDSVKLFDLPRAFPVGTKMDRIRFEEGAAMVSNIRIADGLPLIRHKLIEEGRVISYGINFDVNKDVVRPESYGTLKEMAEVLSENPDLRVKIVGHTDADGEEKANLDLSLRRANAVKGSLVREFGISADRLQTEGQGESKPLELNDTPSHKALNRRVEFIKL